VSDARVDPEAPGTGETAGPSAGEALRRERESRRIPIEEVANALRLDARRIEAIEAGHAPMDTFIRGYIRAYARFLDIDVEALLGTPPGETQLETATPLRSYRLVRQAGAKDRLFRAATWVIVLALAGLLVLWGYNNQDKLQGMLPESASESDGDEILPEQQDKPFDYAYPTVRHPERLPRASQEPLPPLTSAPRADPGAAGPDPGPTAEPAVEPAAQAGAGAADEAAAAEAPASAPATGGEAAAPADTAGAPGPPAAGRVTLLPAEEAWIEAYDAAGERHYFGLAQPGSEIRVEGPRPLRFVVGNAASVTLRAGGRRLDFLDHARDGVARFEVTAEGIAPPSPD